MVLSMHSRGAAVVQLQRQLSQAGYLLDADGHYGSRTKQAVRAFQRRAGLLEDGIAGRQTLAALSAGRILSDTDIANAAQLLAVEGAAIKAVIEVETRGRGHDACGQPVVLFERHVFFRRLPQAQALSLAKTRPDLCARQPGGYRGGSAEFERMNEAGRLCQQPHTANESASWGLFQIMGYHWQTLGYTDCQHFIDTMTRDEAGQLDAFMRFVRHHRPIHQALQQHRWADFARHYNGPAYRSNQYDVKLARAYARLSKEPA